MRTEYQRMTLLKTLSCLSMHFVSLRNMLLLNNSEKWIFSICPKLLQYPCCFSQYFTDEKPSVKLENVRQIIKFVKTGEKGSNLYQHEEEAILEFEMFLLNLSNNESSVDLTDFLKFFVATDRIPIQGFGKPIEIFFVDTDRYPTASTCGLYMTVPLKVFVEKLLRSLKDEGTFGNN